MIPHFKKFRLNMKNYRCIIVLLVLLIFFLFGCASIVTDYRIIPMVDPRVAGNRWDDNRELFIEFIRYTGYYSTWITAELHTNKYYHTLYIKEISITINDETITLLKNKTKNIPMMKQLSDGFFSLGDTEEFNDMFLLGKIGKNKLKHLLKKMNVNGVYAVNLTQCYSFDDEPLRTQTFGYKISRLEKDKELPWFLYKDTP